jgi:hypothetical protein
MSNKQLSPTLDHWGGLAKVPINEAHNQAIAAGWILGTVSLAVFAAAALTVANLVPGLGPVVDPLVVSMMLL